MPLDPQAERLLRQLQRSAIPPFHELTPEQARQQLAFGARLMGRPTEIVSVQDVRIPGPVGDIPIRIYRDTDHESSPAIVFFHGGGWVMGGFETHDEYCRQLSRQSAAIVIAVDYRLAPEHKFPAAIDDAYAATCWVADNAGQLDIDPDRIAVAGDSAGGNLAAVVCLMVRDRSGPGLIFQVLLYPITDYNFDTASYHENATGYHLTRNDMLWCWDHYLSKSEDGSSPYAAPMRADTHQDLPPALVITAEYDPLRDEGESYAQQLQQAGVSARCHRFNGMIHGFARRLTLYSQAGEAMAMVCDELQRAFATRSR